MEALGNLLGPYSHLIAQFASTVTTLQFLSGVFLLNDIRKRGSSDTYPPEPFLGGIVMTVLGLKLGAAMNDNATIKTNTIGIAINTVFLYCFYYYASAARRPIIHKKIRNAAIFVTVCLIYASFEDPAKLEVRLGTLITGILVALVGTPLLHINKIIAKKCTEGMPFPIILGGTIVSGSWMLYGISIKNTVLICQNLLIFCMAGTQLSLFAIYPNTPPKGKKSSSPTQKETKKEN